MTLPNRSIKTNVNVVQRPGATWSKMSYQAFFLIYIKQVIGVLEAPSEERRKESGKEKKKKKGGKEDTMMGESLLRNDESIPKIYFHHFALICFRAQESLVQLSSPNFEHRQ